MRLSHPEISHGYRNIFCHYNKKSDYHNSLRNYVLNIEIEIQKLEMKNETYFLFNYSCDLDKIK